MKSSSSVILIALAVADSLVLCISLPDHYFDAVHGYYLMGTSWSCVFYPFVRNVSANTAIWLILDFTVFRVISICLPHKANVYCTKRRAYFSVGVIISMAVAYSIPRLFLWQSTPEYRGDGVLLYYGCVPKDKHLKFYDDYSDLVALFLTSLIPFAIIIVSNLIIIHKIVQAKRQRQSMQTGSSTADSQSLTAMLISISILFLVSTMPFLITNIIEGQLNYDAISDENVFTFYIIETVTKLLTYVNNVANFFCYCISGQRFRTEFINMIGCCPKSEEHQMNRSLNTLSTEAENKSQQPETAREP